MQLQLHRPSASAFQCEMSRFCVVFGGRWRQDVSLTTAASSRTPPLPPLNNCYITIARGQPKNKVCCFRFMYTAASVRRMLQVFAQHFASLKLQAVGGEGGAGVKRGAAGRRCSGGATTANTQCNLLKLASLGLRQFQHVLHGEGMASCCKRPEPKIRIKNLEAQRRS